MEQGGLVSVLDKIWRGLEVGWRGRCSEGGRSLEPEREV